MELSESYPLQFKSKVEQLYHLEPVARKTLSPKEEKTLLIKKI